MITVKNERGKQVVYILGKRAFLLSGPGIALTPNVETQPVQWDDIEGKPATGVENVHASATGVIDGVNKDFSTLQPFDCVYINGLIQIESVHYTKTGSTTFELSDAPLSGDIVSVIYIQ